MTQSGIKPATFRLVVQYFKQLNRRVAPPPMMVLLLFIITAFRTQNYTNQILPCVKDFLNLLAPELFILILAHPVYKM